MKVTIEGTTKEIAALVQELQERQSGESECKKSNETLLMQGTKENDYSFSI